jgi:hypothetical protein
MLDGYGDDKNEILDLFKGEWRACVATLSLFPSVQCFCLCNCLPWQ